MSKIGIIAEDMSDFNSLKILISRITKIHNHTFKKHLGYGCGKIVHKSKAWAESLSKVGCSILLIVHDLDRKELKTLRQNLEDAIDPSPISKYLICIPIEELEAWLLSDPEGIKVALKMKKAPNVKGAPETIKSPKEELERLIKIASNKTKTYLNTIHNEKIVEKISLTKIKSKCPSFINFYNFFNNL